MDSGAGPVVPRPTAETWAKGKGKGAQESQKTLTTNQPKEKLPHSIASGPESSGARHLRHVLQSDNMEGSSPTPQPQDRVEAITDKSDKRKGKQQKFADLQKDQISNKESNSISPQSKTRTTLITAIVGKGKGPSITHSTTAGNAEGSSKSTIARQLVNQSSGHLVVRALPSEKKQAIEQILQSNHANSSSIAYDSHIFSRRKAKGAPQFTDPENKYHVPGQEALEAAIQEKDIDELIYNAQTSSKNKDVKKRLKSKDHVPTFVKAGSTSDKPSAKPPAQTKGLSGVSKILVEGWAKPKQENDRKDWVLDNKDGSPSRPSSPRPTDSIANGGKLSATHTSTSKCSSWFINDPGRPGFLKSKVSISPGSPGPNNTKTAPGANGKNTNSKSPTSTKASPAPTVTYPKPLTPVKASVAPTPILHKNTRQPGMFLAMPEKLDYAPVITGVNGKGKASGVTLVKSPPDYAKAASGPDGRNVDQKLYISPSSDLPTAPAEPTDITPPTPIKCLLLSPTSPQSSKSWSSIITGNFASPNIISKRSSRESIEIEGFPELGKQPITLSSSQLPRAQKASLSAIAEPFEPAGLRHAASADSYLKTNNLSPLPVLHNPIPVRPVEPLVVQPLTPAPPVTPILLPQTPIEHMSFPFDHLLEIFYDTPEFTKYLNKSYNELLFKENYLRAQYQRISEIFVEEWDYITAPQRKAIIAKALSNLSERVDKVQFNDGIGVEKLLRGLGLTKYSPMTPLLHKPTNPNLRDSYLEGALANEETKEGSSTFIKEAHLKWRAEYCFDCDPDPLCISPDWLYSIISRLLGMPHTLRHRSGPGQYDRNCDTSVTSDHEEYSTLEKPELWCPGDCLDCEEAEHTGWPTEWNFVRSYTSSVPRSLMLEHLLDEIEVPKRYPPNDRRNSSIFSQLSFLKKARLMSNRFTDPIFARSDGWKAANPGRAKFMELMNIDIALFYCELIQEIVQIFGEVRRERVWIALPTIADYHEGLPMVPTQPIRGRPRTRSPGKESSRMRTNTMLDTLDKTQRKKGREEVRMRVLEERKRIWEFVNEVQRTMDWKVAGLKLVDRDTDREVERAHDGGLWTIPVPPPEKEMLEREFSKLAIWER